MVSFEPDAQGHFGPYGGRYVPETLMAPLAQVEETWREMREDPEFNEELKDLLQTYAGRPTPLYYASRLTAELGGRR